MSSKDMYNNNHEKLLSEWHNTELHKDYIFNYDGIVNPDVWFSDEYKGKKILFLLKEAYHSEGFVAVDNKYSLTKDLKDNSIDSNIWTRVAEWARGIQNTTEADIPEYMCLTDSERKESLNTIAVVNLKKSNGKPRSDDNDIDNYVDVDKERLFAQINEINPDIIVCGYTFKWLKKILGDKFDAKKDELSTWVYQWNEKMVIDYYHPANQFPVLLNYYGIVSIYQKAIQKYNYHNNESVLKEDSVSNEETDKLKRIIQLYIDTMEYEKAENNIEKLIEIDSLDPFPWLIKAEISSKKTGQINRIRVFKCYKKALELDANLDDLQKIEVKQKIISNIYGYVDDLKAYLWGINPFEVYKRKKDYLNGIKTLKSLVKDLCIYGFMSEDEINKSIRELVFKSMEKLREDLIKKGEKEEQILASVREKWSDFKKSIDAIIEIAEKTIKLEENIERKKEKINTLIIWLDNRIYLSNHAPFRNSSGNISMGYIINLNNTEKTRLIEQKNKYIEMLESITN